ncbi:MAG: LysE family transporter [Bacillota bacterium]|nr:LysE family transporter [Bacillota bacterium]
MTSYNIAGVIMSLLFVRGLVIGFSIAASVGPIGILCIQRTLSGGMWAGLVSGLGAATADGIYGLVAGLGLTMISGSLLAYRDPIQMVGAVFLCYLGIRIFFASQVSQNECTITPFPSVLTHSYLSMFCLTLTNPLTILSFMGVFAGLGMGHTEAGYADMWQLVMDVFTGSVLWWITLSLSVSVLRRRLSPTILRGINRGAGIIIAAFGLIILLDILRVNL